MSCHVKMAFGTSIIWFLLSQFSLSTLYRRNSSNACTFIALLLDEFYFLHNFSLSLSKYMTLISLKLDKYRLLHVKSLISFLFTSV